MLANSANSTNRPAPFSGAIASCSTSDDSFSLSACRAHIVRKADYKPLGNGLLVRTGWVSKLKRVVQGNVAQDRYKRTAFESSQRISAAWLAEQHLAKVRRFQVDLSDSERIKSSFYRQDNLRFNPSLADADKGLSKRNQHAVSLASWAHHANGITELGAAPTGLLLKISKILFTPNRDDKSFGSQLRVFAALPVIAVVVSQVSSSVFANGLGRLVKDGVLLFAAEVRALAFSFSALTAVSALVSLAFTAGSCISLRHEKLSPAVMGMIQDNKSRHLQRIHALLADVKDKPQAHAVLRVALSKKIPQEYCDNQHTPWLLHRLLDCVHQPGSVEQVQQALESTIGAYLVECRPDGTGPVEFLDPVKDRFEILKRENHFVALANLVEHADIDKAGSADFKDFRHRIEDGAGHFRNGLLKGSASLLNILGFKGASTSTAYRASDEYLDQRNNDRKNPALASRFRYSADNILENAHQYGPLTRGLARMSEGLRIFNHHVLLSVNYQLTRPIAAFAGFLAEKVFHIPNSRTTSFSIGRALASSILAVIDSIFLLSLASGQGVGFAGPEASTHVEFPAKVALGKWTVGISIVSTAAQMLLVALPAALLMSAAKAACAVEGWKGNISPPVEREGSRRQPLQWK